MTENLTGSELLTLIETVFAPGAGDNSLTILVDVPDDVFPDVENWKKRRSLAWQWFEILHENKAKLNLSDVSLVYYRNVHSNNADLPQTCYRLNRFSENLTFDVIEKKGVAESFSSFLARQKMLLAPTQFSATAPLKVLAKKIGFRAATMPGFSAQMIPALRLDWQEINRRVNQVKHLLDSSSFAEIRFQIAGRESCSLQLDLRFRKGHASGGLLQHPGTAGNLPSGESYIVPYEGELAEKSRSEGVLPVQFGEEIVKYQIKNNKAVEVISTGNKSDEERDKLKQEPAYGNLAELGFGVLAPFGLKPIGSILLDEKLGLHIAFGRSDHFGGAVGVNDFSRPENVVHIDRIYITETQPKINIEFVHLIDETGKTVELLKNDNYLIF